MLTDQELTEIRRVWTLLEPAQSFVERSAHNDISALLEHITELESIMRDMQDDSLAYREGVKDGVKKERRLGEIASRPHVPDWSPGHDYE